METIGCEIWNDTKCCLFFYVPVLVNMPVWYNEQNKKWGALRYWWEGTPESVVGDTYGRHLWGT